jgi:hypothetical protein
MSTHSLLRFSALLLCATTFHSQTPSAKDTGGKMSTMGQIAQDQIKAAGQIGARLLVPGQGDCADGHRRCVPNTPAVNLGGTQAEVSIAVDSSGEHVVIGFNDFRGFAKELVSISGFMYSDDGGRTFTDGGQLPSPGNQTLFGQRFPQIFGDPDVKYLGGCNFIYSSLLVKVAGTGLAQTLGIHRSRDCGRTWTGPIEVLPATNPNAQVDASGNALDAADKELMDVDPDTGRVLIGWANFTPFTSSGVEISTTYTDNMLADRPTFAPRQVVAAGPTDGQGASVRFAGNESPNAYISWTRFTGFYTRQIGFSRSTDNGQTWSAPASITGNFLGMDEVLGNDRVNEGVLQQQLSGQRGRLLPKEQRRRRYV